VGLLAVAVLQTSAIKMNSTSNKLTNLSTVAMDQIEKLSALPYTDPDLSAGGHNPTSPSAGYTISYTVAINPPPMDNTKNITITVSGRGKTENISFIKPDVGVL
ncbi:MAG: hypothetical protein ACFFD4_37970, partial [Candidatus Odinarchaeota archaeon]